MRESLKNAFEQRKPHIDELFNDVYDEPLPHLREQAQELREHMQRHPHLFAEGH